MSTLGHCREGYHGYCGGEELDRGDGTLNECECLCHMSNEQEESDNGS